MNRDEIPPAIRKLLAAALIGGGIACAGTWSTPGAVPGTPTPAQPVGAAPSPAPAHSPDPEPAEAYQTVDADDSLLAVAAQILADSLRRDSLRADSLRADSVRTDSIRRARRR
ncbi:MAG TPA: hypothetical protein VFT04_01320 [Gemmatimonadales bacterium]|nr:hypothetical protein [Gemmatimonadales bacterium]